jgi:predicted dehydrogenase
MVLPDELPAARSPDPRTAPTLRWGVIGSGWIAERFVDTLQRLTAQQAVAVGSRTMDSARAFAARFDIGHAHGSYQDLVGDRDVDVVYVATPHNVHLAHAALALQAGKAVLVEKPIAINASQAAILRDLATARSLFCAEALWTLFLPKFDIIRQVLDHGLLGTLHTIIADHGEWFPADHRIMRPNLAGGPLLDLGTYPLSLVGWVLGTPASVVARGVPAPSGVNGQVSAIFSYHDGAQAVINTTLFSNTPTQATIAGSAATLTIPGPFYRPGPFTLASADGERQLEYNEPASAYDGLAYEAAEVARCISAGELGTQFRTLQDSIATMALIDEIRHQVGIVFDDEA